MKKTFSLLLAVLMLCVCLSACDGYTKEDIDRAVNHEKSALAEQIDALEKENAALKSCIIGIHRGGVATCKERAICTSCSTSYGELAAHLYTDGICTLCGSASTTIPDNGTASKFEKKQYAKDGVTINYWLYTPANATENMPLIVYLHGGSGKGDDLELITSTDGFPQYLRDGKITPNAYVLVPQLSSSYKGWGEMKEGIMRLITFVKNEHEINEDRISLTGHSMGGTGVWMLALAYPNTFSAIAPLSGSVTLTNVNTEKLKSIPVWAIVGTEDTVVDPQSSINFITELSKVNAKAKLTELTGADHFAVPAMSYLSNDLDLLGWLIQQSK